MKHSEISYVVDSSFDKSKKIEISIRWDNMSRDYRVHTLRGLGNQDFHIPESRMQGLYELIENLKLPCSIEDNSGFDGTSYEIRIGISPSITYSWWEKLPNEWESLERIIKEINMISEEYK